MANGFPNLMILNLVPRSTVNLKQDKLYQLNIIIKCKLVIKRNLNSSQKHRHADTHTYTDTIYRKANVSMNTNFSKTLFKVDNEVTF